MTIFHTGKPVKDNEVSRDQPSPSKIETNAQNNGQLNSTPKKDGYQTLLTTLPWGPVCLVTSIWPSIFPECN